MWYASALPTGYVVDPIHTVDGRNPVPPKKPRNNDSPVNANKRYGFPWFPSGAKWISQPSTVGCCLPTKCAILDRVLHAVHEAPAPGWPSPPIERSMALPLGFFWADKCLATMAAWCCKGFFPPNPPTLHPPNLPTSQPPNLPTSQPPNLPTPQPQPSRSPVPQPTCPNQPSPVSLSYPKPPTSKSCRHPDRFGRLLSSVLAIAERGKPPNQPPTPPKPPPNPPAARLE